MPLEQNPSLSLFKLLRQKLDQRVPTVRCTKTTLIHLTHTLEDTILNQRIPAMIFAGFQESSSWWQEMERYQALAQLAQQVCIFTSVPLPLESENKSLYITLSRDDPLGQEWFLAILSESFAVILCGQDCQIDSPSEASRQFDTLWSFEPQPVSEAIDFLAEVIAIYQPEQLPQLQAIRTSYSLIRPDLAVITAFTMEVIRSEERLHQRYQETELALQQYQEQLEEQVLERTAALTQANRQLQQEIRERQQVETALAAERNSLRTLIDNLPDLIYIKDTESRFVLVNTASLRQRQLATMDEMIGKTDFDIHPVHLAAQYYADEQAIIHTGRPLIGREELNITPSGQQRWFLTTKVPLRNSQGQIMGLVGLSRDITELKQVEQELKRYRDHLEDLVIERTAGLRAANQQLQREITERKRAEAERIRLLAAEHKQRLLAETLLEAGAAISSTLDLGTVLTLLAEQMGRMADVTSVYILSYESETMNATVLAEYFGPQALAQERESDLGVAYNMREDFAEPVDFLQAGQPKLYQLDNPDLNELQRAHMQRFGAQTVLSIPLLIGGRVTAFAELWESRRRREFSPNEIALCQGIAQQAAIAIRNAQLHQQIQKQARQMEQILHTIKAGLLLLDRDHRVLLANKAGHHYLPLLAGIEVGQVLTQLGERSLAEILDTFPPGHWHEVTPVGLSQPVFQSYVRPVMSEAAETEGWVIVLRDITEERDIQKRMQQQEKLAAVGQLAAGIAHDFNNILTSIIGFAELARWTPDLPASVGGDLGRIIQQGQRAAHLVRQILDFAQKNIVAKRPLELSHFLEEMVYLLERTIPENIRLELKIEPTQKTYLLNADPTQLQQAITNLAVNAADAMPMGGLLQFHLSQFTLEAGQFPPCLEMTPGEWLALSITDTGIGMPPEIQLHLFEPFFTTKEVGQGTGLGLAQLEGIVKQHQGCVKVTSRVGQGTTFTLYFPPLLTPPPPASPEVGREGRDLQGQGELILLVEDNEFVLEVVQAMLNSLGYQVLTAANGRSALEVYERYGANIVLIITDLTMPEMSGLALAEALQAKNHAVKILAMTGYPLNMKTEDLLAQGIVGWIRKPLSLEQLAQQLEQTLQKG